MRFQCLKQFYSQGMEEKIYQRLKQAADKPDSHFQVFKKEDIPDRFHFKHNPRVQPVIALADLQYTFIVNKTADEYDYCKYCHLYS